MTCASYRSERTLTLRVIHACTNAVKTHLSLRPLRQPEHVRLFGWTPSLPCTHNVESYGLSMGGTAALQSSVRIETLRKFAGVLRVKSTLCSVLVRQMADDYYAYASSSPSPSAELLSSSSSSSSESSLPLSAPLSSSLTSDTTSRRLAFTADSLRGVPLPRTPGTGDTPSAYSSSLMSRSAAGAALGFAAAFGCAGAFAGGFFTNPLRLPWTADPAAGTPCGPEAFAATMHRQQKCH